MERKNLKTEQKDKKNISKGKSKIESHLFDRKKIPDDAKKILDSFGEIVFSVRKMNAKQREKLPLDIKTLSHELTDDRRSRRIGYMNDASFLSAYAHYFLWWNLERLVRLFSNLGENAFDFGESAVFLDIGSGPLTVATALWLSRPELRQKKIVWYCLDKSQNALALGEEIFLSVCAKTIKNEEPWKIVRVKGELGTPIKEKCDFAVSANVFNEILQNSQNQIEDFAQKTAKSICSYLKSENSKILAIEPGEPTSAKFISLLRDSLISADFAPIAPCPHAKKCAMSGRIGRKTTNEFGKNAKWCNFAFETEDCPKKLLSISEKANLSKKRAGLSFVFLQKRAEGENSKIDFNESNETEIRIASDLIRLPEKKCAFYACSEFGTLLAIDENRVFPKNGDLLKIKTSGISKERDKKSGALIAKISR